MSNTQVAPLSGEQTEYYHREGYLAVPELLTDGEVTAFLEHIDAGLPVASFGLRGHLLDPCFRQLATHPKITGAIEQLLAGSARVVQTMLLDKPAKIGKGIALHQDSLYLPHDPATPDTLMACWLALSDTDSENGGLCVVPGSPRGGLRSFHRGENSAEQDEFESVSDMRDLAGHRWQQTMYRFEIDDLDPESIVRLSVPRGGAVFFSGLTIHGSFGNHSQLRVRRAFAVHYVREGTHMLREDVQDTMPLAA